MNNDMNNPQVPQQPVPAAPANPTPSAPATPAAQPAAPEQPAAQPAPVAPPMAQGTPTPMTLEQAMQPPEIPQQPIPEMQPMAPNPMQQMQPAGQTTEEPQEAPKRKSKAPLLFVIIIILLVVCGFVYKDTIMNMISPKEEAKEETTPTVETKITDEMKIEINKKIGRLLYSDDLLNNKSVVDYGFRSNVLKKDLTDDEKEFIVLKTTKYEKVDDVWQTIPLIKSHIEQEQQAAISAGNQYNLNSTIAEYGKKSKEDVEKDFKGLFGTDLKIVKEELGKCPIYYYIKDQNIFIQGPARCGGTSAVSIIYYVNEYKRTDDVIEVHMNFGAVVEPDNKVYSDFDSEKRDTDFFYHTAPKNEITITEKDENGLPTINEKNYKDFSEYVFKFKKSSTGEFTFESVKQVEK